jgi:hypothetical protein
MDRARFGARKRNRSVGAGRSRLRDASSSPIWHLCSGSENPDWLPKCRFITRRLAWTSRCCGKKTDLTLGRTERPEVNLPGDILILDFPFRRAHAYTYHREKTPQAIAVEERWLKEPDAAGLVRRKAAEHARMLRLSADPDAMRAFLDSAPDGLTYARLASIIG